jgi:hypothetical protein
LVESKYGVEMSMQPKKEFALVDYEKCNPAKCNPDEGICAAVKACTHKVIKQIDGVFEPPIVLKPALWMLLK